MAEKRPHEVVSPHGTRIDEYYWLRDDTRQDPAVLAYLEAENAYKEAMLAHTRPVQERLFQEIVDRIQKDDSSVPVLSHGWWEYTRYEAEGQYPIHARKARDLGAAEQIVVDGNARAVGHAFYTLAGVSTDPGGRRVAFAEDTVGRRQFEIRVRDLTTGEVLDEVIRNANPGVAWANDGNTFFYVDKDPVTLLGRRIKRHVVGTDPGSDPVVYEEPDTTYHLNVGRTVDDRYVVIHSSATVSDEVRYVDADRPEDAPRVLIPRSRGHEYDVDHLGGRWFVRSNDQARNFRIMALADGDVGEPSRWTEVVPHTEEATLSAFTLLDGHLVIGERSDGLNRIRVLPLDGSPAWFLDADEAAYTMAIDANPDPASRWLRYSYASLTSPHSVYEVDLTTRERRLLKVQPVPTYDPSRYVTERVWARARDGERVPVSVVYREGFTRDGTAPLYVYGYGSYGASSDPWFRGSVVSLLDRGFVYAIAHIRGGEEMGRRWYDHGKLAHKWNTFTDFVDVTEHLLAEGYGARDKVAISGGSAGGLLMGAVVNLRPDLFTVVAAHVPFVDVVTTMLDESIPLTTIEFDEWGNPKEKASYDLMLSYSPYDQVTAQPYPAMLVTTGLWDSQVQYYEPAKWVARLRARGTGTEPLLFHVNMEAGHGGASGRFRRHRETAMEYAFILDQLGIP